MKKTKVALAVGRLFTMAEKDLKISYQVTNSIVAGIKECDIIIWHRAILALKYYANADLTTEEKNEIQESILISTDE